MGLETATYINQLVPANPAGSDDRSQGDDHLRLVKQVLQNTFPNVTGPVTPTQSQINSLADPGKIIFPGMIVMWSGTTGTVPSGWKLCNGSGTISNGNPVPDLRGRFIVGSATDSGGDYNIGNTGGNKDLVVSGSTQGHTLTVDQIPPHTHSTGQAFANFGNTGGFSGATGLTSITGSTGGGQPHSHTISITTTNGNLPPYYALAFIIKD